MAPTSCHMASTSWSNMDTEIPAINSAFSWGHSMCNRGRKWRKVEILSLRKLSISLTHFLLHCIGQKVVTWPQVAKEVEKYSFCSQGGARVQLKITCSLTKEEKKRDIEGRFENIYFGVAPLPFDPTRSFSAHMQLGRSHWPQECSSYLFTPAELTSCH